MIVFEEFFAFELRDLSVPDARNVTCHASILALAGKAPGRRSQDSHS
jgi:hypothetical protein